MWLEWEKDRTQTLGKEERVKELDNRIVSPEGIRRPEGTPRVRHGGKACWSAGKGERERWILAF